MIEWFSNANDNGAMSAMIAMPLQCCASRFDVQTIDAAYNRIQLRFILLEIINWVYLRPISDWIIGVRLNIIRQNVRMIVLS